MERTPFPNQNLELTPTHTSDSKKKFVVGLDNNYDLTTPAETSYLEEALKGSPLTLFIQDEELRYLWVSNQPEGIAIQGRMLGHTDLEIAENSALGKAAHDAKQRVLNTGVTEVREFWVTHKDGQRGFYRSEYSMITMGEGKLGILGKTLNLTAQQIDIEELSHTNNKFQTRYYEDGRQIRTLIERNALQLDQLRQARDMQLAMLPKNMERLVSAAYTVKACLDTSVEVGGDYYDTMTLADGSFSVSCGDATGHGVKAGMMTAAVKGYVQALAPTSSPGNLLEQISAWLETLALPQMYMALAILKVDGPNVTYASAGMPPLLWVHHASGVADWVFMKGLFLGSGLQKTFAERHFTLAPQDMLVMLSDGYYEQRDPAGQIIRPDALAKIVQDAQPSGPQGVVDAVRTHREAYTGLQTPVDDATVVALLFG